MQTYVTIQHLADFEITMLFCKVSWLQVLLSTAFQRNNVLRRLQRRLLNKYCPKGSKFHSTAKHCHITHPVIHFCYWGQHYCYPFTEHKFDLQQDFIQLSIRLHLVQSKNFKWTRTHLRRLFPRHIRLDIIGKITRILPRTAPSILFMGGRKTIKQTIFMVLSYIFLSGLD
jgi:hypothetical protein